MREVLYLEDNPRDGEIVGHKLKAIAKVQVCPNKMRFLQLLRERRWSCILMDLNLPDVTGEEAIKIAKETVPQTPVIILTGSVDDKDANKACAYGARRYFLKDRMEGLPDAIEDVCKTADKEDEDVRENRAALLGHTVTGIIHDWNNVLGPFLTGPPLLRKLIMDEFHVTSLPESMEKTISAMEGAGRHGAEMSKQITAFVRGSNGFKTRPVTAEYLLTEIGQVMRDRFPKNIRPSTTTHPGTSSVKCDPTQIHQVLLNLCVNARDAMPGGGEIHVTAQDVHLNEPPLVGEYVMFHVRDTGPGIPEPVAAKIFEPYFTTKDLGKGTGVGLSVARKIVLDHKGEIDFKTGEAGTSFFVYLPATREGVDAGKKRVERFDGQGKTVLFVDDEVHMRHLVEVILEDAKYRCLIANGGMEALSYFRSGEKIHLLLTDLDMPMMDGQQLSQLLRAQRFNLPIIMVTGQPGLDIETLDPRPDELLHKPIEPDKLLLALKVALRL